MIDTLPTVDFWKIVEEAFIRPRNITFDRHVFSIMKQLRGETVEKFCGKLKELAVNCDFKNKVETLISDVFITNLMDPEIQMELLKQTVEPRQALELAWNLELHGTWDAKPTSNSAAQQDCHPGQRQRSSIR